MRNSQHIKAVGCFRKGAPSLMFDGILNASLPKKKISTTVVAQGNFKLLLPPNSPDSHQTQMQ